MYIAKVANTGSKKPGTGYELNTLQSGTIVKTLFWLNPIIFCLRHNNTHTLKRIIQVALKHHTQSSYFIMKKANIGRKQYRRRPLVWWRKLKILAPDNSYRKLSYFQLRRSLLTWKQLRTA